MLLSRKKTSWLLSQTLGEREYGEREKPLWIASRTRDVRRKDGTCSSSSLFNPVHPPALRVCVSLISNYRLSDGPAPQRPELHQSRSFVLRGRPDWAIHESVHPLHHRHTLRAVLAPGGDRGRTEKEAVAKAQSTKREARFAAQRNVSKILSLEVKCFLRCKPVTLLLSLNAMLYCETLKHMHNV